MTWMKDDTVMDQSLLKLKQWSLEELERKLTLQIGDTKVTVQYK